MEKYKEKVYFIGAGPGDPELITIKGQRIVKEADVIIYAGSLVPKEVIDCHKEGAEIFFAPNNPVSKEEKKANPKAKSNYETAKEAAKQIHSKMKIVPVKTLQDAIDYLKKN